MLEIGKILHIFPSGTESMGGRGSKKGLHGSEDRYIYCVSKKCLNFKTV